MNDKKYHNGNMEVQNEKVDLKKEWTAPELNIMIIADETRNNFAVVNDGSLYS